MRTGNIYQNIPGDLPEEMFEVIAEGKVVKIERIISRGHTTDSDFMYDQDQNEWVIILRGEALLRFEGEETLLHMKEGSYVNIPAHVRHRVEWTSEKQDTVWLAVFYDQKA